MVVSAGAIDDVRGVSQPSLLRQAFASPFLVGIRKLVVEVHGFHERTFLATILEKLDAFGTIFLKLDTVTVVFLSF